ncbi:MAG: hypothetical protein ACO38P_05125 [Phycisphaerales bacterium]
MTDRRTTTSAVQDAVPIRRRRWRAVVAIGGAVLVAIAAIVVAWGLDRDNEPPPSRLQGIDVEDLVRPSPLSESERAAGGGGSADLASPGAVELAQGGWIEVADELGRLRQRYAAKRMEPLPDRWMSLDTPRAVFYGEDGRVTRVSGAEGTARIPDRAIESGTLRGDVRIEVFRPVAGGSVSVDTDDPWLVVLADEVEFDDAEGRIRSDGVVSIESEELTFSGEGMLLFLDESGRDIERLVVERAISPLRLVDRRREDPAPSAAPAPAKAGDDASPTPDAGSGDGGSTTRPPSRDAAKGSSPPAPSARLFRLALDGGVLITRGEGDSRSTIEGDRLGAIFSMRSGNLGAIASREALPMPGSSVPWRDPVTVPLPPREWLAASAIAQDGGGSGDTMDPVEIEIEFGGSLLIEPLPSGVPRPESDREVWVRVEGSPVIVEDPIREAVVRCAILEARTGLSTGDRLDLLSPGGLTTIESPSLHVGSPSIRVAGRSIDLAGPGWLEVGETREPEPDSTMSEPDPARVRIEWAERLALQLGPDERSIETARFEGGDRPDGVVVESDSLLLSAPALDAEFFARTPDADRDRLRRVEARGGVVAIRRGDIGRISAARLVVALRDDRERAIVERFEAEGSVRALDASRLVFADRLAATFLPPAIVERLSEIEEVSPAAFGGAEVDRAEAVGDVVVGLSDGTWVFADRLDGDGPAGRLELSSNSRSLVLVRDTAVLDGLESLELRDSEAGRRAAAPGPGRLRSGSESPLAVWEAPTEEILRQPEWEWPARPSRPEVAGETRLAAVWTQGLAFDEPAIDETSVDRPVAELVVRGSPDSAVRARSVDADGREDRLSAQELRVRFTRVSGDGETPATELDPSDLLATGAPAVLEARRPAAQAAADQEPDVFRISGPRIEYGLATREGRVVGAGTLLVSEAPARERAGATARFSWKGRLDLLRTAADRSLVTLADDVEMIYATRSGERRSFSVTASRMEATVREVSPAEAPREESTVPASDESPLGAAELEKAVWPRSPRGRGGASRSCPAAPPDRGAQRPSSGICRRDASR